MKRLRCYQALVGVAILLVLTGSATAQEFRATVKGQVVDSSQASLPGATVTVRNQETNEVATATTNNTATTPSRSSVPACIPSRLR